MNFIKPCYRDDSKVFFYFSASLLYFILSVACSYTKESQDCTHK